jgi:hypothetical protein
MCEPGGGLQGCAELDQPEAECRAAPARQGPDRGRAQARAVPVAQAVAIDHAADVRRGVRRKPGRQVVSGLGTGRQRRPGHRDLRRRQGGKGFPARDQSVRRRGIHRAGDALHDSPDRDARRLSGRRAAAQPDGCRQDSCQYLRFRCRGGVRKAAAPGRSRGPHLGLRKGGGHRLFRHAARGRRLGSAGLFRKASATLRARARAVLVLEADRAHRAAASDRTPRRAVLDLLGPLSRIDQAVSQPGADPGAAEFPGDGVLPARCAAALGNQHHQRQIAARARPAAIRDPRHDPRRHDGGYSKGLCHGAGRRAHHGGEGEAAGVLRIHRFPGFSGLSEPARIAAAETARGGTGQDAEGVVLPRQGRLPCSGSTMSIRKSPAWCCVPTTPTPR